MPKSSKKAGPPKGRQLGQQNAQTDFTLAEFANADPAVSKSGRMKKGSVNALKQNGKEVVGELTDKENLAWDEKDLSEFDQVNEAVVDDEENSDEACSGSPRAKVKRKVKALPIDNGGLEFPTDVWFLIGDWIAPESVATFSVISKGAHLVVHTARFWNSLYKRHYRDGLAELPKVLRPCYMEKIHGLRTRIVRSLFYLYPPFVQRIKALVPFEQQLDELVGSRCSVMWYQKVKSSWHFFFKFRTSGRKKCIYTEPDRSDHLWLFAPDIYNNEEEDLSVLQVVTSYFIPLPVIMGYTLRKASISVGHAMRYHKLRLIFSQCNVQSDRYAQDSGVVAVMDPVINIRVLRWWNPAYPGNSTPQTTPPTPT